MSQTITTNVRSLVDAAEKEIENLSVDQALALHGNDAVVLVDIRDIRELQRDGRVPGAFHCPRGMLEFWIDPESPYHKPVFAQDKKYVFFCAGGLRSAKAARALIAAGHRDVRNLEGGIFAWANADRPMTCHGRPTRYAHPSDEKWGALLARDRHAWTPRVPE